MPGTPTFRTSLNLSFLLCLPGVVVAPPPAATLRMNEVRKQVAGIEKTVNVSGNNFYSFIGINIIFQIIISVVFTRHST